jgi:hypothetical protein
MTEAGFDELIASCYANRGPRKGNAELMRAQVALIRRLRYDINERKCGASHGVQGWIGWIYRAVAKESPRLFYGEPISNPDAKPFRAFDPPNPGRQFWTQYSVIRSFVGQAAGAGNGITATSNRARRRKRWTQTRSFLQITAPVLDPTTLRRSLARFWTISGCSHARLPVTAAVCQELPFAFEQSQPKKGDVCPLFPCRAAYFLRSPEKFARTLPSPVYLT